MSDIFGTMSAAQIHQGLASKEFSAAEMTDAILSGIDAADKSIHAFLQVTPDLAHEAAQKIDQAIASGDFESMGPLAGVPCAYKDNMNLRDTHTTCASKMLENYVSPFTATCVQDTLDAGCIPVGKTNMDEFAFGSTTESSVFGPTKNPWDQTRVPGGSSGGSAAAVAAGMVPVALGSDTGGSIRQPAGFCGVVGVKPTYGVVSRYGVVAFGSSLDQVGPFARNVHDAAEMLNAIQGRDPKDCTSQQSAKDFTANLDEGVKGMKVGVVPAFMESEGLAPEVKNAIEAAAKHLEDAGAELVEIELPNAKAAISAYYVLGPCEAFSNLARFDSVRYGYCDEGHKTLAEQYEASRAKGFGAEAKRRIMLGSYLLSANEYHNYYYPAQQIRTLITQDYQRAFEKVDVILGPVSPCTAFKLGEITDPATMYLFDMFTVPVNISGNGGMSVPLGLGKDSSMPVGAQLICPAFGDENMFRVAAELERCYGSNTVAPDFASAAQANASAGANASADGSASAAVSADDQKGGTR